MTTAAAPPSANGSAPARPSLSDACQEIVTARSWVYTQNVESNWLIDLLFLSAASGRHGFIVGDGGTGKSKVTRDVFTVLPGTPDQKFVTQFRKDMDTQAVFGPISLSGLTNDDFRHVTAGFLAEALWAYCDEFGDASTLIIRSLLMVMNERQFPNGRHLMPVPLRALIGTSNFWRTEPEVAALMDRFAWRFIKEPVQSNDGFMRVLKGQLERDATGGATNTPPPSISMDALDVVTDAVRNCPVPETVLKAVIKLRESCEKEGLFASVRRYGEGMALARARAVLAGRTGVTPEDLVVFSDVLASEPEDIPKAYELCQDFGGTGAKEAKALRKTLEPLQAQAQEIKAEIDADGGRITTERSQRLIALISEVNIVSQNADAKVAEGRRANEDVSALEALGTEATQTVSWLKDLALAGLK